MQTQNKKEKNDLIHRSFIEAELESESESELESDTESELKSDTE